MRSKPTLPLTYPRPTQSRLFQNFPARLAPPKPASSEYSLPPDATRMQRLKHLFRHFGAYALGVYILISVFDFGLAFGLINIVGAEHVESVSRKVTTAVKEFLYGFTRNKPPEPAGLDETDGAASSGSQEGLYAMLLLAYTVHKTLFLPLRVGLTIWLTPNLVGWLRQRGWAGRAGTLQAAAHMRERIRSKRVPRE
ncbi:DUF1279 domain-containing protein [Mycena kentingensis (nom. inval.)]|nr:DUF1279 domain-containing protein [Mycena kentingensis (nom. inval.)]